MPWLLATAKPTLVLLATNSISVFLVETKSSLALSTVPSVEALSITKTSNFKLSWFLLIDSRHFLSRLLTFQETITIDRSIILQININQKSDDVFGFDVAPLAWLQIRQFQLADFDYF